MYIYIFLRILKIYSKIVQIFLEFCPKKPFSADLS